MSDPSVCPHLQFESQVYVRRVLKRNESTNADEVVLMFEVSAWCKYCETRVEFYTPGFSKEWDDLLKEAISENHRAIRLRGIMPSIE